MFEMYVECSIEDCECCGMFEKIIAKCDFDGIKKDFGTNTHLGGGNLSTVDYTSPDFFIDIIKSYSTHLKEKYNVDISDIEYEISTLENGSILTLKYHNKVLSFVDGMYNIDEDGYENYIESNPNYFKSFLDKENIQYNIKGI